MLPQPVVGVLEGVRLDYSQVVDEGMSQKMFVGSLSVVVQNQESEDWAGLQHGRTNGPSQDTHILVFGGKLDQGALDPGLVEGVASGP